jgi:hypothetical protein
MTESQRSAAQRLYEDVKRLEHEKWERHQKDDAEQKRMDDIKCDKWNRDFSKGGE